MPRLPSSSPIRVGARLYRALVFRPDQSGRGPLGVQCIEGHIVTVSADAFIIRYRSPVRHTYQAAHRTAFEKVLRARWVAGQTQWCITAETARSAAAAQVRRDEATVAAMSIEGGGGGSGERKWAKGGEG